jgi:hypothetical protein
VGAAFFEFKDILTQSEGQQIMVDAIESVSDAGVLLLCDGEGDFVGCWNWKVVRLRDARGNRRAISPSRIA